MEEFQHLQDLKIETKSPLLSCGCAQVVDIIYYAVQLYCSEYHITLYLTPAAALRASHLTLLYIHLNSSLGRVRRLLTA